MLIMSLDNLDNRLSLVLVTSRARKLCFSVISENYYTNYNNFVWLFGSKKRNIFDIYFNLSLICLYIILFMT